MLRRRSHRGVAVKTILVAIDGSDSAAEALDFAIELCKETGAALEVLSVKPKPLVGRGGGGLPVLEVEAVQGAEHIAQTAAEAGPGSGCTREGARAARRSGGIDRRSRRGAWRRSDRRRNARPRPRIGLDARQRLACIDQEVAHPGHRRARTSSRPRARLSGVRHAVWLGVTPGQTRGQPSSTRWCSSA